MNHPSPGSCRGLSGLAAVGTVPIGAALSTTRRRTSPARMASTRARVPASAIPASAFEVAPSAETTASAPRTASASATGSGSAKSTRTALTSAARAPGLRTRAVTSCPASSA